MKKLIHMILVRVVQAALLVIVGFRLSSGEPAMANTCLLFLIYLEIKFEKELKELEK